MPIERNQELSAITEAPHAGPPYTLALTVYQSRSGGLSFTSTVDTTDKLTPVAQSRAMVRYGCAQGTWVFIWLDGEGLYLGVEVALGLRLGSNSSFARASKGQDCGYRWSVVSGRGGQWSVVSGQWSAT